ncbi:Pol protein [Phytophthora palmivora]|uniref:Pol protein n=1 Tax=Phytophthora palmivora TaxID=4796 RepID=A0A2P4YND6_9STRA|nr:Pol protein [Phytophthora palmivora]
MVEFALNSAEHASTGFTPFNLNIPRRHPHVPPYHTERHQYLLASGEEVRKAISSQFSDIEPESLKDRRQADIDQSG